MKTYWWHLACMFGTAVGLGSIGAVLQWLQDEYKLDLFNLYIGAMSASISMLWWGDRLVEDLNSVIDQELNNEKKNK